MDETIEVVVVRVFTDESGRNGNELGIVTSSPATASREQDIANALGFSETVFVDEVDEPGRAARIRIFTPAKELPFAGHPSVGTAWWLADRRMPVDVLREPAGDVEVAVDDDTAWITARAEWTPAFEWLELKSPEDVDALDPFAFTSGQHFAYAWIDEAAGTLRARMFAPEMGIIEDEATGAAAIALTARLGRPLSILQGEGSQLATEPLGDGRIRVGGTTVYDRTIDATL
ncbi:PhzF family phenazine biosynthesis protein [Leifsonia sp. 21MFCrub1.1]|uniref:PhzF family phenazine biosynthesis protein n=1 Tax=Leifsonia sp. 21MFCrub1.1 TaxID=1798223 RepID=UPI00089297F9|nr:PhzF family phenazine biosynthesis protein [Leifsonia sp. 21MFCrub1.1]SEB06243.1 phenazine biosynthesis protein PhzF family [Leifsonia sp. 21MFCrub1.1]